MLYLLLAMFLHPDMTAGNVICEKPTGLLRHAADGDEPSGKGAQSKTSGLPY